MSPAVTRVFDCGAARGVALRIDCCSGICCSGWTSPTAGIMVAATANAADGINLWIIALQKWAAGPGPQCLRHGTAIVRALWLVPSVYAAVLAGLAYWEVRLLQVRLGGRWSFGAAR